MRKFLSPSLFNYTQKPLTFTNELCYSLEYW